MISNGEKVVQLFSDLVSREDSAISLPTAALVIARVQYPDLDDGSCLDQLAALGERAAERLSGVAEADRLAELAGVIFGEFRFRGNRDEYYDPRNSFLNDVLERRLGIPITLSLVYIEIARACGWAVDGIGFPGHFLVRDVTSDLLVDPFNEGIIVDDEQCRRLLASQGIEESAWSNDFVRVVSNREFLARIINNLRRYYSALDESSPNSPIRMLDEMSARLDELAEEEPSTLLQ